MGDMFPLFAKGFVVQGVGIWVVVGMLIVAYFKMLPLLDKARRDGDASLRGDLMARINKLEADLNEQRKRCDENESRMRDEINGLHRQIISFQVATARAIPLGPMSPEMNAAVDHVQEIIKNQFRED